MIFDLRCEDFAGPLAAAGEYVTAYGPIGVEWEGHDDAIRAKLRVPHGCRAFVGVSCLAPALSTFGTLAFRAKRKPPGVTKRLAPLPARG
jgi:hypothetical protein